MVQHKRFRRILGRAASQDLFALLETPPQRFGAALLAGFFRRLTGLNESGRGRLYLNVGHTGLDSPGFRQWLSQAEVKPIYFVHDLIPITHPQFCRPGEDRRHRERMRSALMTGQGIIANSQSTLDELAQFGAREGLPTPAALAAWLGVDQLPRQRAALHDGRPTFVTLGTIEARKNHLLLLNIWSRLVDRLGSDTPRLLIIGQRGWEADEAFKLLDTSEKLRGHVSELNRCSDEDLARHLTSARALLFPSLAEGYGLPLVEALGAGVPVIASDLPVFREVGGAIPDYLHPRDELAWEAAILDYSNPASAARAAQLRRIQSFRLPDWQMHFRSVEAWLRTLG